jgi:peptide/nickel transport system ATP-binding protein
VPALLQIRNLNIGFPGKGSPAAPTSFLPAVRDLSLFIAPGEVLGLVGESGSGKSVTSLAIMRLLPPQAQVEGEIVLTDNTEPRDLASLDDNSMRQLRGSRMAMIFQEPMTALNPVMRVGEQIAEAVLAHHAVSKSEAWKRAVDAMNDVAIPEPSARARDYPHQLSGGMRQRIVIAMAIVNRPQ